MLSVRINIRNDQKNGHAHHQIKDQLVIFLFVLIEEDKICDRYKHVRKPQQVRDDKHFTKWDPVIKYGMYDMVAVDRTMFKVTEHDDVK